MALAEVAAAVADTAAAASAAAAAAALIHCYALSAADRVCLLPRCAVAALCCLLSVWLSTFCSLFVICLSSAHWFALMLALVMRMDLLLLLLREEGSGVPIYWKF